MKDKLINLVKEEAEKKEIIQPVEKIEVQEEKKKFTLTKKDFILFFSVIAVVLIVAVLAVLITIL